MEVFIGAVLGALVTWFVVYTAVRGAIGGLLPEPPAFRLTWLDRGESGELTLENAGRAPVFEVVVRALATSGAPNEPLMAALLLHPGERLRVAMDAAALGDGERADAHERVVVLAARHRSTLVPQGAEIRTTVPVRMPVVGTAPRTFA
jgi:hypothetical protein